MTGTGLLDERGTRLEAHDLRLSVSGEVDFEVAAALAAAGNDWLARQDAGRVLTLDLQGVNRVSSAALSVLLEWTRRAQSAGLDIEAVRLSPPLARLTHMAGLDTLLPIAT